MSEKMIIEQCSPTLAGIKTGSMFSCSFRSEKEIKQRVRNLNRALSSKGLRVLPLRYHKQKALIYIYRPAKLKEDFCDCCAEKLLRKHGYPCENPEQCIVRLVKKMQECPDFPHEIGLFLGYPPEDVQGFIENKADNCKCIGCWKVYGDEEKAKNLFEKYKRCTQAYVAQWANGHSIDRLTVTV